VDADADHFETAGPRLLTATSTGLAAFTLNGLPAYHVRTRGWRVLGDRLFSSPRGHETQELDPRTGAPLRRVPRAASEYRDSLFGTR
jgi:hypothetical protein